MAVCLLDFLFLVMIDIDNTLWRLIKAEGKFLSLHQNFFVFTFESVRKHHLQILPLFRQDHTDLIVNEVGIDRFLLYIIF